MKSVIVAGLIGALLSVASVGAAPSAQEAIAPGPTCGEVANSLPINSTETSDPAAGPLDGRLGGSPERFQAIYGQSKPTTSPKEFDVPGTSGGIFDDEAHYVTSIMLFAPRANNGAWDLLKPSPENWDPRSACALALRFLPVDVQFDEPIADMSTVGNYPCTSATLAATVPESIYAYVANDYTIGQCSVVLEFDTAGQRVSEISIDLKVERPI